MSKKSVPRRGSHNTLVVWTMTEGIVIVFHSEIVAHLVSDSRSD